MAYGYNNYNLTDVLVAVIVSYYISLFSPLSFYLGVCSSS